jgi:hypothetical protein
MQLLYGCMRMPAKLLHACKVMQLVPEHLGMCVLHSPSMLQMAPARRPRLPLLLLVMNPADDVHRASALPAMQFAWKSCATSVAFAVVAAMYGCHSATQSLHTLHGVFSQAPNISQETAPVLLAQLHTRVCVAMLQKSPVPEQSVATLQLPSGFALEASRSRAVPATPVTEQ